jgi:peptide/nickel transport system substrate-binding protein
MDYRSCSLARLFMLILAMLLAGCTGSTPSVPSAVPIIADSPTAAEQPTLSTSAVAPNTQPVPGGTLRVAIPIEPDTLDPSRSLGTATTITDLLYDRLVSIGADGLPKPWLAESWQIGDAGKTITFTLRTDVRFTDGTALDAQAVQFSFERIIDPQAASPVRPRYGSLERIVAPDARTVVFYFAAPYAPFFTNLSLPPSGIVSPGAVQQQGEQFGRNPVGSGPFRFASWTTGAGLQLTRNPAYVNHREGAPNRGAPYLEGIAFQVMPDPVTQIAALKTGAIDLLTYIDAAAVGQVTGDQTLTVDLWQRGNSLIFLQFAAKPTFGDLATRQAIAHAIDYDTIVARAFQGYATRNASPLPNGLAGWDATITGYGYDPQRARELLAQSGWQAGADGMLTKDGVPNRLRLLTYSGVPAFQTAVEIIQANLQAVGLAVEIEVIEIATLQTMIAAGESDLVLAGWSDQDPAILSVLFKSPGWSGQLQDSELDSVLDRADSTLDPQARLAVIREAQQLFVQKALAVPLVSAWVPSAVGPRVQGFGRSSQGSILYEAIWLE